MAAKARKHYSIYLLALVTALGVVPSARAVTSDVPIQVLDQLDVFSATNLKRSTETPIRFDDLNSVATSTLKSCQNGRLGLTCLDGQLVRNWPVPKTLTAPPTATNRDLGKVLFSCEDDALQLDVKGGACTSLTVDVKGHVWIAARKSSNSHNLIELIRKAGTSCDLATEGAPLTGRVKGVALANTESGNYCYKIQRTGRPLLLDISAFDGELASSYKGPGILGVESRKTVVFFPSDGSAVVEIGAGKNDWSLLGGEQVFSAALLQYQDVNTSNVFTYGLITTSTGRVMWKNMADALAAKQIANINSSVSSIQTDSAGIVSFPRGTSCETGSTANFFEIRASDTTGRLFFSNRNFCKVFVAAPEFGTSSDNVANSILTLQPEQPNAIFPTLKVEGISVSPGIAVDLTKCGVLGCDYIKDGTDPAFENNYAAARMIDVTLAPNSPAGLIVFQIRNIPDCRYLTADVAPECTAETVVETSKGKYLNVTPLLPQQIKDLFNDSGKKPFGLPPMYISPRYRAQSTTNGNYFEALFGVTDPKVTFRKTFTAQFDVGDDNLAGKKLGCGAFSKDSQGRLTGQAFQDWDIVTVVSERFSNVGGPRNVVLDIADDPNTPLIDESYAAEHVDMLGNKDCFNPTSSAGTRWSMYSFNLQLAEDATAGFSYAEPRKYLGNLLYSLFDDLTDAQSRLACANVDAVANDPFVPSAAPPLNASTCSSLASNLVNARDKLDKCIIAATDPKTSALDQNCQSFDSQIKGYRNSVFALTPTGADPANRVGELVSRADVIYHVFKDQFLNAPLSAPTAP